MLKILKGNDYHKINGTGLQGYLDDCTYNEIVEAFGEPSGNGSDDKKVTVDWALEIDGVIATIYDWKTGIPYKNNTKWNIGGFDKKAIDVVYDYMTRIK